MSIFPCQEFLDRRPCFAVVKIVRATTGAMSAARPRDVFARSGSLGVASTGAAHALPAVFETGVFEIGVFEISIFEVLCAVATTVALVNAGLSSRIAEAVSSNDQESTMPLASNAADRAARVRSDAARL